VRQAGGQAAREVGARQAGQQVIDQVVVHQAVRVRLRAAAQQRDSTLSALNAKKLNVQKTKIFTRYN
jgi:hypothetical protein